MVELNIDKFEAKRAELIAMSDQYNHLVIKDIDDKEGYETMKKARIELRDARIEIQKVGKAMRDDAIKFQKAVIAKEKEYLEIIEPLEKRLKAEEDEYKRLVEIESRKESLPERRKRLEGLIEEGEVRTDEEILTFDDKSFDELVFNLEKAKLEKEKAEVEAKRKELEQQEAEAKRIKEAEEKAREEEKLKAQAEIARLQKEKEDAELKVQREKEAEEKAKQEKIEQEKKEKEQAEKDQTYQERLKRNDFNEGTDRIMKEGNRFTIYRFISSIVIE